jgi:hypothetical protein
MNNYAYLGIVQNGKLKPLLTDHSTNDLLRLTNLPINSSEPPENSEISLTQYEGSAIIVRGFDKKNWIYSAIVIEKAGLILTTVVQEVFKTTGKSRKYRFNYPLG